MAKPLNFNNVKKKYLTVTLADEKKTTLIIGTPTKAIMDDLLLLQSSLETINEDETNAEATDDLYLACTKVMSRNKGGIKVTKEFLENLFDFEDIMIFFEAYMDFIGEVTDVKN
ncbi:hypothetical protein [Hominilimicola sp.]|uniref:hypothetical protein n=1 Tax=Hominilimicola sp. TaxID=3073571 RepID=UPI0039A36F2E